MEGWPQTVAGQRVNRFESVFFRVFLDRVGKITSAHTFTDHPHKDFEGFLGESEETRRLNADLPDRYSDARIGIQATEADAAIQRNDVAVLQNAFTGNAVYALFIHRCAKRGWVSVISFKRWLAATLANERFGRVVEFTCGNARRHEGGHVIEAVAQNRADLPEGHQFRGRKRQNLIHSLLRTAAAK